VTDYLDAPVTHFVSMVDSDDQETIPMPRQASSNLQLIFSDLDDIEMKLPKYFRYTPPQEHDIAAMVNFGRSLSSLDDFGLLAHCEAGISRSTAAAITILTAAGYRPQTAFGVVRRVCPEMLPNRRILRLADGALQTGGSLYQMAENHRRKAFLRAGYEDPIDVLLRESREDAAAPKSLLRRFLKIFPSGWRTLVGSGARQRAAMNGKAAA
jgi:predicted protein tyrosine phosphatase